MNKEKKLANILFWLTLVSPMVAFAVTAMVGEVEIFGIGGIVRYSWIMWFFLPIGLCSFFVGNQQKRKNQNYKRNIVIAYICVPLIALFGSFRFTAEGFSYDINKVIVVENQMKIELPKEVKIATSAGEFYDISYLKIVDKESQESFEAKIVSNDLWTKELSSKIASLLPFEIAYSLGDFDYFIFYNLTTDKYNSYPENGTYECAFVAYDCEMDKLLILDGYVIQLD